MLLLINADNNPATGWFGYDFILNKKVIDEKTTTLMRYDEKDKDHPWIEAGTLNFQYTDNELELAVPRDLLKLTGKNFTFDFKWSDNASELEDPVSFCVDGDTAPNRRFNYRFIWTKK